MAFGKPNYSGNARSYTKYVTPKEGEVIRGRVVPPVGINAADGLWHAWHACHFGYTVPGGEGKAYPKLFKCNLDMDYKTKIVKVPCQECSDIQSKKDDKTVLEAEYKKAGKSDADIKELLAPLNGWLKTHNRDSKRYINFKTIEGEHVVLMLSPTTFKGTFLDLITKTNEKQGVDCIMDGVVFEITAVGKQLDKVDKIEIAKTTEEVELANGKKVKMENIQTIPWTDAEAEEAESKCINLKDPDRFITLTNEQVELLTKCSGDPDEVVSILSMGSRKERSASPKVVVTPKTATKPVAAPVATQADTKAVAEAEALKARLKELESKAAKVSVVDLSDQDVDGMSDEEFIKAMKPKQ